MANVTKKCCLSNTSKFILFDFYPSFDDCTYIFEWKTPVACPRIDTEVKGCTVRDDYFGHTFNLSALHKKNEDYNINDISVNVCGGLSNKSGCKTGASICYKENVLGMISN